MASVYFNKFERAWNAQISYAGESIHLLSSDSKALCEKVAELAERAKANNRFEGFYTKLIKKKAIETGRYDRTGLARYMY